MSRSSFKDIINSDKPVLLDFYADWCGPCHSFAPILEKLQLEVGDQARVVQIDVDKNPHLTAQLHINSIPTVMIFHNGELKWKGMGVQTLKSLKREIESLVA